ncbi:MAG: hypothetical protein ACXVLK_19555 [Acidimicrobiales bacterium]
MRVEDARGVRRDDRAAEWLRLPTGPPADPGRFTPDLYPAGPPLAPAPATGEPFDDRAVAADLARFLEVHLGGNRARIDVTLERFNDSRVIERLPDAGVRAGFLTLTGTLGDLVIEPFLTGELPVVGLSYGVIADASRVVGPAADPGELGTRWRVVNQRYRYEPFPLLAGSLMHDLLHHEPAVSDAEETVLHALLAAVHLQVISRSPALAGTTELARRQNSLALSLLCSRRPGEAQVRIVAPDGLATIPGGSPSMQTPDFWSIPFAPDHPDPRPSTLALRMVLDALLGPVCELDRPVVVDDRVAELLDDVVLGRELLPHELVAAAEALTLV